MTVGRLAAIDAQNYWMSAVLPNDQFLLYAFGGPAGDLDHALHPIRDRARSCPEFGLRITDTGAWAYPVWTAGPVADDQFVVHRLPDPTWQRVLAAVAGLADQQLDPRLTAWRLHVFDGVEVPGVGVGTVAVLQISHALGDGVRASALAAHLFGRVAPIPTVPVTHPGPGEFVRRAVAAAHAHRRLVRDTDAGLVPPPAGSRPALRSNARPDGARELRTLSRARLPGPTVTVAALSAISAALAGHLRELGEDVSLLGAEVPMAKAGTRRANNHFGNVTVGLYPQADRAERSRRIDADLHARRRRAAHPAMAAESAVFAALPAPLLRWGIRKFDPAARSPTVSGNTVVSSVNRGAADLWFGTAPVALTAGPPALSPMMGLTHGVHGVGDTVTITVHAAESAIGDIDAYVQRLDCELG